MWEGHHNMTVNKCDSMDNFHRSSTRIHFTKLQLTEIVTGKAHNARLSWGYF